LTPIALRSLVSHKLRAVLTGLAILLGVMMVAATYVLTDTIEQSFDDILSESNEGVDAVVTSKEEVEQDDGQEPPIDQALLRTVRAVDGVAAASGAINDPQVAIIDKDGDRIGGQGAPTFAVSAGPDRFDPLSYPEGRPPEGAGEVVIDRAAAEKGDFAVGDQVTLAGKEEAKPYTLVGIATLGDVDSFGGASLAELTLPEAQRITGKQGLLDQINVAAADGVSPGTLADRIEQVLPRSAEVETGEQNTQSQKDEIDEFIGILQTILLVFAGVALFVASFLIFNTFSITVAQRTREFAMLRTLGANRRQIITSVVVEALAIGAVASVIGLFAGIAFAPAIGALFDSVGIDLPQESTVVATRTVIVSLLLGIALTLGSALVPALRATRVPPVTGLREGAVLETSGERRRRGAVGVAVTALGIVLILLGLFDVLAPGEAWVGVGAGTVFVGVALLSPRLVPPLASVVGRPLERFRGVSGRIARENATRNPGRTAITAAALMIGLALVSFVAILAAGLKGSINDAIDKTVTGELIVSNTDGFSDIPLLSADAVRAVPEVEAVSPTRYTQARTLPAGDAQADPKARGDSGPLTLVDPATATEVMKLEWKDGSPEILSSLGPTDAVVDEGWADDKDLDVGDVFVTTTASGKRITYTVRGTFTDNADFFGNYIASDADATAYGEGENATNLFVKLAPEADLEAVHGGIDDALETGFPTTKTEDQEELKDSISSQLNQLLGVVYALLFLAVIVSLFGIVNTLALSIYERTRELGLLRAVGMSRRQVRRIVRYEAVITALIGAVLGAILGVIFAVLVSRPLADEGFTLTIPIPTLLLLLVLAAFAGVLAAIGPARRASRLDVLRALAYE
jgi:putative ABC transport system permease protein